MVKIFFLLEELFIKVLEDKCSFLEKQLRYKDKKIESLQLKIKAKRDQLKSMKSVYDKKVDETLNAKRSLRIFLKQLKQYDVK